MLNTNQYIKPNLLIFIKKFDYIECLYIGCRHTRKTKRIKQLYKFS